MTAEKYDAALACAALELDAATLADLFKREAARQLDEYAQLLRDVPTVPEPVPMLRAQHYLMLADAFEAEWERRAREKDGSGHGADGSPTGRPRTLAAAAPVKRSAVTP